MTNKDRTRYPNALELFVTFCRQSVLPSVLTNQVGIPVAAFNKGGGMYISLGLLVLIILLVVLLR